MAASQPRAAAQCTDVLGRKTRPSRSPACPSERWQRPVPGAECVTATCVCVCSRFVYLDLTRRRMPSSPQAFVGGVPFTSRWEPQLQCGTLSEPSFHGVENCTAELDLVLLGIVPISHCHGNGLCSAISNLRCYAGRNVLILCNCVRYAADVVPQQQRPLPKAGAAPDMFRRVPEVRD